MVLTVARTARRALRATVAARGGRMNRGTVFLRFCAVGLLATALHYAVLFALARGLDVLPELATSVGFVLSTALNYLLNRRYTFRSRRRHQSALPRFLAVVALGVLLNALVLSVCYRVFGLGLLASQVIATLVVLVWNFLGHRHWVFPARSGGAAVQGRAVR
jgi:putative flippase GtrA